MMISAVRMTSTGTAATRAVRSFRDDRSCRSRPSRSGSRSEPRGRSRSWRGLREHGRLTDERAESRVGDLQPEYEAAIAEFLVGDAQGARARPAGPSEAPAPQI